VGAPGRRLRRGRQPRFADIFRTNALKNGLVPVQVDEATHARLVEAPGAEVTIDLEEQTIAFGTRRAGFPSSPSRATAFSTGRTSSTSAVAGAGDLCLRGEGGARALESS